MHFVFHREDLCEVYIIYMFLMKTFPDLTRIIYDESQPSQIQALLVGFIKWRSLNQLGVEKQPEYKLMIEDNEYAMEHCKDGFLADDFRSFFQSSIFLLKAKLQKHENMESWKMTDMYSLDSNAIKQLQAYLARFMVIEGNYVSVFCPIDCTNGFRFTWVTGFMGLLTVGCHFWLSQQAYLHVHWK